MDKHRLVRPDILLIYFVPASASLTSEFGKIPLKSEL